MAIAIGFDEKSAEEIVLVASELASNVVRHAGGGTLTLAPLAGGAGIQIESEDRGPGIADVDSAMADGFSTAGSLGYGLGTVNRFVDDLDIATVQGDGCGLHVLARRWIRDSAGFATPCPLAFGVATRPRLGSAVNGDAFVVKRWGQSALVGVIDGLGHGRLAHEAAQVARQYVDTHFDRPLDLVFKGTARACVSTRGVVMALIRFDWAQSTFAFGSVGNVEARLFGVPKPASLVGRRGVLGHGAPPAAVTEHPWQPGATLVLHSDGLRTRWRWEDFPALVGKPPDVVANELLRALGRDEDDGTVIVVREVRE